LRNSYYEIHRAAAICLCPIGADTLRNKSEFKILYPRFFKNELKKQMEENCKKFWLKESF
jgi:hypothetical protein